MSSSGGSARGKRVSNEQENGAAESGGGSARKKQDVGPAVAERTVTIIMVFNFKVSHRQAPARVGVFFLAWGAHAPGR